MKLLTALFTLTVAVLAVSATPVAKAGPDIDCIIGRGVVSLTLFILTGPTWSDTASTVHLLGTPRVMTLLTELGDSVDDLAVCIVIVEPSTCLLTMRITQQLPMSYATLPHFWILFPLMKNAYSLLDLMYYTAHLPTNVRILTPEKEISPQPIASIFPFYYHPCEKYA